MSQAARIEESLVEERLEELDLGPFVDAYARASASTFESHAIQAVVPRAGQALILGAPDPIAQLLDKLVENAVSFAPPGSRITLRVVPMHRSIALQVDNLGPALPEIEVHRLFDSMTSHRHSQDPATSHLGLGLFIVRMIAERHAATVRASNREQGVRFQVEFPRRRPQSDQELP